MHAVRATSVYKASSARLVWVQENLTRWSVVPAKVKKVPSTLQEGPLRSDLPFTTLAYSRETDPMHQDRIDVVLAPSLLVVGADQPSKELSARPARGTALVFHFETQPVSGYANARIRHRTEVRPLSRYLGGDLWSAPPRQKGPEQESDKHCADSTDGR